VIVTLGTSRWAHACDTSVALGATHNGTTKSHSSPLVNVLNQYV
jgi:hypothetical protein